MTGYFVKLYQLLAIATRVSFRNKGLLKNFKKKFPNVPDYVMKEIYNGDTDKVGASEQFEQILESYDKMKWKLQKIDLHWDKLNNTTKNNFKRRKFGIENPDQVPKDAERLTRQIESLAGDGENEPMIFIETERGLELIEGFHRTMALLLKGTEDLESTIQELAKSDENQVGDIAKKWQAVPVKAWVGKENPAEEDEFDMGDWQS